jgi:membrane carboxypeptidase/penicillin-binding protein
MSSGTGAGARALGVPGRVAGKTGTTNDGRDAWFVGYSSNLLALVWVGFDDGTPHGLSGADAALPIWSDFMRQALTVYPAAAFETPPGVTIVNIDPTNGKRAGSYCPLVRPEAFLAGTEPEPCTEHGFLDQIQGFWKRLWSGGEPTSPQSADSAPAPEPTNMQDSDRKTTQRQIPDSDWAKAAAPPRTSAPSSVARTLQPSGDWAPPTATSSHN